MNENDINIRLLAEIARVEKAIDDNNAKPHRLEKAVRHACEEQERILEILYRIAGIPKRGIAPDPESMVAGSCTYIPTCWPENPNQSTINDELTITKNLNNPMIDQLTITKRK